METGSMNEISKYARVKTVLGEMVICVCGGALIGAWFVGQKHFRGVGSSWIADARAPLLVRAASELDEYFAGRRTEFDLPLAPVGTPFQRDVWQAIARVPSGTTITYGELAMRAGHSGSIRAAGAATGRNPLTIFVPCHRIVGANGALTGYARGLERKRALLALEQSTSGTHFTLQAA